MTNPLLIILGIAIAYCVVMILLIPDDEGDDDE